MTGHGPTPEQFFDAIQKGNDLAVDAAMAVAPNLLRTRRGVPLGYSSALVMIAVAGGRLKVTGRSRAMVAAGPIPGRTPIRVPTKHPARQRSRFTGVIARLNPDRIF